MGKTRKIVITGAGGFIGKTLLSSINSSQFAVTALVRRIDPTIDASIKQYAIEDLTNCCPVQLSRIMTSADYLIHLAAVVPGKHTTTKSNMTQDLARVVAGAAAAANIQRIIVLSSVYAELAEQGSAQARKYGHEKQLADRIFHEMMPKADIIFLRPPVVYGSGMTGSLLTLAKLVAKNIWLPLGSADSERTYVSARNLVDLLLTLIKAEQLQWNAANRGKYVPTDGVAVSTIELINAIAAGLNVRPRTVPIPLWVLRLAGRVSGKTELISGAIDPLHLNDNNLLHRDFGWVPKEVFPECYKSWATSVIV